MTGQSKWTWSAESRASPETAGSNTVYASTSSGGLYALDTRTGARRWQYERGGGAVGPVGDSVYTANDDEHAIEALNTKTGKVRWRQSLTENDYEDLDINAYSDKAIFVSFGDREIRALRAH